MSNNLKFQTKTQVVQLLVEGSSMRSNGRVTGVHRDTISRLLLRVGNYCQRILAERVRDVHSEAIEMDELWSFVRKKQARLSESERLAGAWGDAYVFVALDVKSRLVISHLVGKRTSETALEFAKDVRSRLTGRPQIFSDGWEAYVDVVEQVWGADVDYAQVVKEANGQKLNVEKRVISGTPKRAVTTSYVERQNLTVRTSCGRFVRRSLAHSKRMKHMKAALSLHYAYYNFVRIHSSLKVTPAMEAGIATRPWELEDLLAEERGDYCNNAKSLCLHS